MFFAVDAQYLRLGLRVYFIIATLLIGIAGDQCRKAWNRLALARRRTVPLHYTTGWITGFPFVLSCMDLMKIPAGSITGTLMLVMTILAPAADLAVSGLVVSRQIPARCDFNSGMVVSTTHTDLGVPPWNGLPARAALAAQQISLTNGGLQGIYNKVSVSLNVSAQAQDVIAGWTCAQLQNDLQFDAASTPDEIVSSLAQDGYQYGFPIGESQGADFGYEHLVIWSASATNAPFDVLASVDLTGQQGAPFVMRTWSCKVQRGPVDDLMAAISTNGTLSDWAQLFQGRCYDGSGTPARSDTGASIEQILNTIVMVVGGSNYFLNTDADAPDPTQGCLTFQALVPPPIFALAAVFATILLAVLLSLVTALARTWSAKRSHPPEIDRALELLPNGLTEWMLTAARESAMATQDVAEPMRASALKQWKLDLRHGTVKVSGPGETNGREYMPQTSIFPKGPHYVQI